MQLPKIKPILFTSKTYKEGTHPIMIRITQDRKVAYLGVGHSVSPEAWDQDNCRVYEKKPQVTKRQEGQLTSSKVHELRERYSKAKILSNAAHINSAIIDAIETVYSATQKLKVNKEQLDLDNIRKSLKPQKKESRNISFLTYSRERENKLLDAGKINTYKRYKMIISRLETYMKNKDLKFSDLTMHFLENYEVYLISHGFKVNTVHNHLKTIRAILYSAIKEGIAPQDINPFFVFKLKLDKNPKRTKLSVSDIQAIEQLDLTSNTLIWHVRNFFLVSFYCAGIRVSDLLLMKWENVTKSNRLEYAMEKTGTQKSLTLAPKTLSILSYYRIKGKQTGFIFPFIDTKTHLQNPIQVQNQISSKTALINKYLKKIATQAEIEISITTHLARHSFADIARQRGASLYDISKMLGHSSIKITETYLASLDIESQDKAHLSTIDF